VTRFRKDKKRMDALEAWRHAKILPLIRGRLLDVGCGFNNLVEAHDSGIGIDVFPWEGIHVLVGSSATLPFPSGSFDTVTIVAALNHIPNRADTLLEIQRVLRSSGRLIVTMIGPRTGIFAHILFGRDERTRGGMLRNEEKGMTRQDVMGLLNRCGFTTAQIIPFQLGLNHVFVAVKSEQACIPFEDLIGKPENRTDLAGHSTNVHTAVSASNQAAMSCTPSRS